MFNKVVAFCGCVFALSGCIYNDEPMPKIMHDYTVSEVTIPPVSKPSYRIEPGLEGFDRNIPKSWYPPKVCEKGWKAIIVHHSAHPRGNAAIYDQWHRNGRHWKGVGYDFVIGNGSNSGDGQVEVTFRWRQQIPGAHVGGTPGNWANTDGIGICLVGDFTKTQPTSRQMQSLVKLVRFLQKRYKIPMSRVYGHRTTPGYTNGTKCPGRYFPMAKLKSMLRY